MLTFSFQDKFEKLISEIYNTLFLNQM